MTDRRRPVLRDTGTLVVGLGSVDRGDDAVGPVVARAVAALALPNVRVVEHEDPTSLIDLWSSYDVAIVVDAVRSGAAPGTIQVFEANAGVPAGHGGAATPTGENGTHTFGVVAAIELSRALHRLPHRLVLVAVEAAGFEYGAPLSPPVGAAVEEAVEAIVRVLRSEPVTKGARPRVPR